MAPATEKPLAVAPSERSFAEIRAEFPVFERELGGGPVAYLDSAASAQQPRAVIEAVDEHVRRHHSNVHRGAHTLSAESTAAYEAARSAVASHLGATDAREVVFTRNATEAINLVARSWATQNLGPGDRVLLTELEHHSNIVPWQMAAEQTGAEIDWAPITDAGELDLEAFEQLLSRGPKLVAVTHLSNVLGTLTPLAAICRMAREAGAVTLVDGAQAAPKLAIDVAEIGCDFYVLTGHKLYAPTGVGALWGRRELLDSMPPFNGGGSMIRKVRRDGVSFADVPTRFEAGTPPIAQAIGLGAAVRWAREVGLERIAAHDSELAGYAIERIGELPGARLFGPPAGPGRLGPVSFEIEGIHAHDLAEIVNRRGVCVRSGHHCAQILMERLGVTATTRASFGPYSVHDEVDRLVEGLADAQRIFAD